MENITEPLPTDRHPLGFWLRAVDGLITREFATAFDGEPVDRRDWMILNALDGSVDESLAERVRERLARRPKRLVRLAELGWIASSDGRWTLTEEGRAAKDRLASRVDDVRRRVAGAVSDEDFATTLRTLEAIARDLGGDDPQALRAAARGPRGFGRHGRAHGHGRGVKDAEQEYVQEHPFDWMRAYQVGGRSLLWARQTQRWSDFDFEGPARDGYATDWPIRYADIAPWYSRVEKFAGISGNRDGVPTLPDGEFLPAHEMSCVEKHFKQQMATHYKDRYVVMGRAAHLTQPKEIHYKQGRAQCQNRVICERGCPYGGYFSSASATIPWAMRTGKLTLRPHSVVHSVIYDDKRQKASGVRIVDANTREMIEYYAKIIFVNASTVNSNLILLNSISNRFPNGLGNDSGILGKYMAFHTFRGRITAEYDGLLDSTTEGKRPNSSYVPRFRNVYKQETDFLRGYAAGFSTSRGLVPNGTGIGEDLKNQLMQPKLGLWQINSHMMGETIPKEVSRVWLDKNLKDKYGIPQLHVSVEYDDNDDKMLKDFWEQFSEMYAKAGFKNIQTHDTKRNPGSENHEMGGVRMGKDPKTSMLNKWNQMHYCKNVFVTDGACMPSTSTQNPSLTYMALTGRAVDYAVKEMKARRL